MNQEASNWLLQLPDAALHQLLQKLDPGTLACTAVTCSQLNHAVLADISKVTVRCSQPDTITRLNTWFERNSTILTNLRQCSIAGSSRYMGLAPDLHSPLCPHLQQLHLKDVVVEFQPAGGGPGVLQDCTGLTALDLEACDVLDVPAAGAAIAALSSLRELRLTIEEADDDCLLSALPELPLQLTHLKVKAGFLEPEEAGPLLQPLLQQLSRLIHLEHLKLDCLPEPAEVPDGFLSQLVKLTSLDIKFGLLDDAAEKFQHLSSLTALQQLTVCSYGQTAGDFSVIERLSQLTSLYVKDNGMYHQTASTHMWLPKAGFLTALQSVALRGCKLQLTALSTCTQLQDLALENIQDWGGASMQDLLGVMSHLSQLTSLLLNTKGLNSAAVPPSPEAFTALTISTKLRKFCLVPDQQPPPDCILFNPGTVYPALGAAGLFWPCARQLQQLCSCCPAVQILMCDLVGVSPTALLPLTQLTALTNLMVHRVGAAAAALVNVAAQLTGLKHLQLEGLNDSYMGPAHPALQQLTALTRLQQLEVRGMNSRSTMRCHHFEMVDMVLQNKAGSVNARPHAPDLTMQSALCDLSYGGHISSPCYSV